MKRFARAFEPHFLFIKKREKITITNYNYNLPIKIVGFEPTFYALKREKITTTTIKRFKIEWLAFYRIKKA